MQINIARPLKKFVPHLIRARDENLNEADTVDRIEEVLKGVLGYTTEEITKESQIKGKFVDIAIKLNGVVRLLIEVKRAGVKLRDRHIEQAEGYAAKGNVRWVLLTNGVMWNLYHLTFEEGIESEHAFIVDLSSNSIEEAAEDLGILHRKSIMKGEHEKFWQRRLALSPESIAKVLFAENVLRFIRKEIRKREEILIDIEDIAKELFQTFSPTAQGRIGAVKIYKSKHKRKAKDKRALEASPIRPPSIPGSISNQKDG